MGFTRDMRTHSPRLRRWFLLPLAVALGAGVLAAQASGFATGATLPGVGTAFSTVRVRVPAASAAAPFDQPRTSRIPIGWTVSVWARVDGARFALWTPQLTLLVSTPGSGQIV